ncbi:MAG: signal recognition particle protein Srp19 [Candidatus Bathyarchaeota archaeon]|nr:signal recognition particle protein Srp19 [Candidatus Bathyarchaeota archaeon]
MRKQQKIIIWPTYFDAGKTRMKGRRVPKNLAVPAPKSLEIEAAAAKLGLEPELIPDKGYPKTPWNKMGMVLVEKQDSKEQVINRIAKQLQKTRNEAPKQQH